MSASIGHASFDEVLSTTLKNYRKTLTDNVFDKRAMGNFLMRKGRMEMQTGATIVRQLVVDDNSTVAYYSNWDPIDLTPQDGISAAEFDWRQVAASVVVTGIEKFKNSGDERLVDLVKARVKNAENSLATTLNTSFLTSYGTGTSNKEWFGLPYLVGDEGTTVTTVGGIDCTTSANAFWRSPYVIDSGGDITLTLKLISLQIDSTTFNDSAPDFAITTIALYEAYEALLVAKLQLQDVDSANAGFKNISNRGVTIMWDRACTAKHFWTLNSEHLTLVGGKGRWMINRPFVEPEDKDGSSSLILAYGNLTTDSRRSHGVHKLLIP